MFIRMMLFAILYLVIGLFEVPLYSMLATKIKFAPYVVKVEALDDADKKHCYVDDFYFSLTDQKYIDKKKLQEICKGRPIGVVEMLLELCHFWSSLLPVDLPQERKCDLFTSLISECDACVNAVCEKKFHSISDVPNSLLLFKMVCLLQRKVLCVHHTQRPLAAYAARISKKLVELMGKNAADDKELIDEVLDSDGESDSEEMKSIIAKDYYLKHKKQLPEVSFKPIPLKEMVAAETLEKTSSYSILADKDLQKNSSWFVSEKSKVLDLSKKKIADLTHFEELLAKWKIKKQDVDVLDLSENSIEELPENFLSGFTKLKKLNVRKNLLKTVPVHFLDGCTTLQIFDLHDNPLSTSVAIETFDLSVIENRVLKAMISHILLYWATLLPLSADNEIKKILFKWLRKEFKKCSYGSLDLVMDRVAGGRLLIDLTELFSFWSYIPDELPVAAKVSMFNAFLRSKQASHPLRNIDEPFFHDSVRPLLSAWNSLPKGLTEEKKIERFKRLHARDDGPAGLRKATKSKKQCISDDSD